MSKFGVWKFQGQRITPVKQRRGKSLIPRDWQKRAFDQQLEMPCRLVNAPMGSGKSVHVSMLALRDLSVDPTTRVVISVPQQIIASGFTGYMLGTDDTPVQWTIPDRNHFYGTGVQSNAKGLYEFLRDTRNLQSQSKVVDRVAITTHQTLSRMSSEYAKDEFDELFAKTSVFIDEAHHVAQTQIEEEAEGINRLGSIVDKLYDIPAQHLTLITATPFRGDQTAIIAGKALADFEKGRFDLPYDEYLKSTQHLQSFRIELVLYEGNDWMGAVKPIVEATKSTHRTIYHLPHPNSNDAIEMSDKIRDTKKLQRALKKVHGKRKHLIVDLVTPEKQDKGKDAILDAAQTGVVTDIIALGIGKEGMDYKPLNRSVIIGRRGSLVDLQQTIGRPLRDFKGKKEAVIYWCIPKPEGVDDTTFRGEFNGYLKAVSLCMLMQRVMTPKFSTPVKDGPKDARALTEMGVDKMDTLLIETVGQLIRDADDDNSCIKNREEWLALVQRVCEESGVECTQELADALRLQFLDLAKEQNPRKFKTMLKGINVDQLDMDLVYSTDALGGFTKMISKDFGVKLFSDIREKLMNSADENKKQLLEMARNGEDRPYHTTSLAKGLEGYMNMKHAVGDRAFAMAMRKLVPWWFISTVNFDSARNLVHTLGLKTHAEYKMHPNIKKYGLPKDVNSFRKHKNWKGINDFLGSVPRKSMKNEKCVSCGKEFQNNTLGSAHVRKYCSRDCYADSMRIISTRNCLGCNSTYNVTNYNRKSKYCSRGCFMQATTKITDIKCEWCRTLFMQKQAKNRFCTKSCAMKYAASQRLLTRKTK